MMLCLEIKIIQSHASLKKLRLSPVRKLGFSQGICMLQTLIFKVTRTVSPTQLYCL